MNKKNSAANLFIAVIALIAWFALILQLYIMISSASVNHLTKLQATGRFFAFYTILTNLLVAINLTAILLFPRSAIGKFFVQASPAAATAVYILIVGIIYNFLLRQLWKPEGWQKIADELLHVIVPLLYILYWGFLASKKGLQWKNIIQWLTYPLLYFIYMLIRGAVEGFYPYPFLNVKELGYTHAFLNAGGMIILFVITGFIFIAIARRRSV
ncbi:MAG: site-specific DNA-methyltransferase [Bacteroidetes bacterium]|nr:site-specific DNA-methyltransferase [Bacteroidota bacterium]MBS1930370.1 site-specific DNA-methyltransferase [Bacteroidota bacterium]